MRAGRVNTWTDTWADVRRSFEDFLAVPAVTVGAFLLLAAGTYTLDRNAVGPLEPLREFLKDHFLADADTTETFLGTIAGGMITVTSITFSLLLLVVQQSASSLTTQVLDQFLRRRLNQFYFGVFVGVALYALVILATNNTSVTPVFGSVVALGLTMFALAVLVFLLYTTLNQMRANRIIEAIHDLTLKARERQQPLLRRTRRAPRLAAAPVVAPVHADNNGYVARLHLDRIAAATSAARGEVEVVLRVALGSYVCYRDVVAEVRAQTAVDADALGVAVLHALDLERQRNSHLDPGYGVTQLSTIGWTSISSAKSNPSPALASLRNLRDLLARWSAESASDAAADAEAHADGTLAPVPVVYEDTALAGVLDAFESLAVAAAESCQHQSFAEILSALGTMLGRVPPALRPRTEDVIRRVLPLLAEHAPTADLDDALGRLASETAAAGLPETTTAVQHARDALHGRRA